MMSLARWLWFAVGLVVVLTAKSSCAAETQTPQKPNVLFIAVDDLNDWTGILGGHPGVQTPNLDRLMQRGTWFSRAYCSAPASGRRPRGSTTTRTLGGPSCPTP
jgi:hypothetical protein